MSLDDKYTYPGSGGVLVNRFGIRDAARLDQLVNDIRPALDDLFANLATEDYLDELTAPPGPRRASRG